LDVPVVATADSSLLHLLDGLRRDAPQLYARVSHGERAGTDELRFKLGGVTVRTASEVTVARFKDILPVEADLARNHLRAVELDLRFRDQVIARQP
jgi:cell division protein FtsQ